MIDDFSLKIASGEKIGLVGRSGAGKTTLMNLLLRFYDLERGRVLIDEQDIAQMTQESLRSRLVWSLRTLRCCIAPFVRTSPTRLQKQLMNKDEAARKANAWEFIQEWIQQVGKVWMPMSVREV